MVQRGAVPLVSTLALAAAPRAVCWAREHVVSALCAWELGGDVVDVARLLTSELVTNAVRVSCVESRTAGGAVCYSVQRISIRLQLSEGTLQIAVWDSDSTPPVLTAATPDMEGGRGLQLVAALAKQWDFYPSRGGRSCGVMSRQIDDLNCRRRHFARILGG